MKIQNHTQKHETWTPHAATRWSLTFTPLFGAIAHMSSWKSLGKTIEARASLIWIWGISAAMLASVFLVNNFAKQPILLQQENTYRGQHYLLVTCQVPGSSLNTFGQSSMAPSNKELAKAFTHWGHAIDRSDFSNWILRLGRNKPWPQ